MMRSLIALLIVISYHGVALPNTLSLQDAHHLLNRTGFGASPHELSVLTGQSRSDAIAHIVKHLASGPRQPYPQWTLADAPHHFTRNELDKVARRQFNEARENEIRQLREWWVREMIETDSPQTERLVLFWHNHFATEFTAINDQAIAIARQHITIRQHAAGNFRNFLQAMIRDPALLNYLDNNNSKKSAPNENLARELLELFTLGEGHYTESDIKEIARALTGYSINPFANLMFEFKPGQHDTGLKTIFGQQGNFDGDEVVDLLLEKPQAARFIATKFWHWLVSHSAPEDATINLLAQRFMDADYDIKTLYSAILHSDEFWAPVNRNGLIKSPAALLVGAIRTTGTVPGNWQTIPQELQQLGQQLFDPPNVAGWPGGNTWITPSRLLNRMEWLKEFTRGCPQCTRQSDMSMNTSMSNNTMNSDANTMQSGNSTDNTLLLHMASEEFDEPVAYRVTVMADDTLLWTSGKRSLPGGRDTKRFGKAKRPNTLPWRDVHFTLPAHAQRFDAIEVEFLNNKSQQGADRNLYIKYASFKERHYDANSGKQTNHCPRSKRARGGVLLCNGKVRLSKTTKQPVDPQLDSNQFTVSGVYPRQAQPLTKNRKKSSISFTLTDVAIDDHQWHTITAHYGTRHQGKHYALQLTERDCWPHCFKQWPDCGGKPKQWRLDVSADYQQRCEYKQLETAEQKLIDVLVQRADEIYQMGASSKKLNKQNFQRNYQAWEAHLQHIAASAGHANSRDDVPAIALLPHHKLTSQQSEPVITAYPLAGGRSLQQYQLDIQQLMERFELDTVSRLLFPNQETTGSLNDALTHLAYQLH